MLGDAHEAEKKLYSAKPAKIGLHCCDNLLISPAKEQKKRPSTISLVDPLSQAVT